jgi:hypothetical protein
MQDLIPLDRDMSQYIHDNTEDELTHEVFININAYLASNGADTVNLDRFRTLPSLGRWLGAVTKAKLLIAAPDFPDVSVSCRYRPHHLYLRRSYA